MAKRLFFVGTRDILRNCTRPWPPIAYMVSLKGIGQCNLIFLMDRRLHTVLYFLALRGVRA